ncbi:MAG: DUF393 domain-containing protein [Deltaproteobacteria bacterium]|nr:DUF393 domain-containing protein [Deltaproteobacteria bacterium]
MPTLRWLSNRYLRIDPRSLGLFRVLFGFVLLGDLCRRWQWLPAFYSNDGVLPNHNHLFNLRESGRVFSVYHAFSHRDEAFTAFAFTWLIYLFFTLGVATRVFTILSAFCLVSLAGRNILTNGVGDSLAIALALFAIFLPLGERFSIDALRRSFASADERDARALNDRRVTSDGDARGSLAALAILLVVGVVTLAAALQQKGATWTSGDALHYALRSDRLVTGLAQSLRDKLPAGLMSLWTKLLRGAEFVVLPLLLVPVARRYTRGLALVALGLVGLTYAAFFDLGAYGASLLAALALVVPTEMWDAAKTGTRPIRVLYDEDCGMCLWLARLLKRLDRHENVTFVGNGAVSRGDALGLPADVTPELVDRTIVVLTADGRAHVDAGALSELLRALPLLGWLGLVISLPGIRSLTRAIYQRIAAKRLDISVACGLGACGLEAPPGPDESEPAQTTSNEVAPFVKLRRALAFAVESLVVGLLFATFVAATEANNELPRRTGLGERDSLLGAASYARLIAPWGVFAPEPPMKNEVLVTVGAIRDGAELDVLTGEPPDLALASPGQHRLGPLWANYIDALRRDETAGFRQELRRYLTRGGKVADDREQTLGVTKLRTLLLVTTIPAPGAPRDTAIEEVELLDAPALPRQSPNVGRGFGHVPRLRHALTPVQ